MDLDALPEALAAAGQRVQALADTLPPQVAQLILDAAKPPVRTGALAASGRVEQASVVYGGGIVTYAAPVHSANPWLDAAQLAADDAAADLADNQLADAITL